MPPTHDCLIVGAGVIGLSLAYELSTHGSRVRVIDAREPGQESSWAGVGIFPPDPARPETPYEKLQSLSTELHGHWARRLLSETDIDNEFHRCGAIYVARDAITAAELAQNVRDWQAQGIAHQRLSLAAIAKLEPRLALGSTLQDAYLLPDEYQMRNSRHLKALVAACTQRGVEITTGAAAEGFAVRSGRVESVRTSQGEMTAKSFCITAGAWSRMVGEHVGLNLAVKPMRGQIVLLRPESPLLERIYYEGARYLVPRRDGRILVGSTVEDVGFDRRTVSHVVEWLLNFAHDVVPDLRTAQFETVWSGLRPGNGDGFPYLGRAPHLENLYVATGHFRAGLHLAPGTAVVMSQLIRGQQPQVDLEPFRVDR